MIINTKRNSEPKKRSMSSIRIGALVISIMFSTAIMLSTMTSDSFAQGSNTNTTASSNKTGTTSGNVTAQVAPQGTSLKPPNNTTASSSNAGQGTAAAGLSLNCQSMASTIGGVVVSNPSKICDVLIPRQAPVIIGPGNMNMNKFSTINSIVEVASVSDLMTTKLGGSAGGTNSTAPSGASSASSPQKVFVMGEFSLLEPQLIPMVKAAVSSNWTIAAVHNHMVLEKPKMMFVHWSAQGDLNTITSQIKNVLLTVSKVPSSSGS